MPLGIPGRWYLVFDDEFGGPLNTSNWNVGWFGSGMTAGVQPEGTNPTLRPRTGERRAWRAEHHRRREAGDV